MPKFASGQEIAHSVLTQGRPVLAAGEADISISGGYKIGIMISNYSGHYLPSAESLNIGLSAFSNAGFQFSEDAIQLADGS